MTRSAIPEEESPRAPVPAFVAARPAGYAALHLVLVPALLGAAAWIVQHSAIDLYLAGLFFDATTRAFTWRASGWLEVIGHHAARSVPIVLATTALAAAITACFVVKLRPLRTILFTLAAAVLIGPLLINFLKTLTAQRCPVDMQAFGGAVDYAINRAGPFWALTRASAGRCLPSGHAGGGYALFSLYFAGWAAGRPAWRWWGLATAIAIGLAFSAVRVVQGAHFASATLWSASVDWTVCALLFMPLLCRRRDAR